MMTTQLTKSHFSKAVSKGWKEWFPYIQEPREYHEERILCAMLGRSMLLREGEERRVWPGIEIGFETVDQVSLLRWPIY